MMGSEPDRKQQIGRYRALLGVASAIASQSSLQTLLESLRAFLLDVVPFDALSLLLLSDDGKSVRVAALERGSGISALPLGAEAPIEGTSVGIAISEQHPVYISDIDVECARYPVLSSRIVKSGLKSGYIFPLSTPRGQLGALTCGSLEKREFSPEDLELMVSVASHVAVALEGALASDAAGHYQRQLSEERDRLRLLLEINNHLVQHLQLSELFRAASVSLRRHFANDFVGLWLLNKKRRIMECAAMDFPDSKGSMLNIPSSELTSTDIEDLRSRRMELLSRDDMKQLPPAVQWRLEHEGIETLAVVPLSTSNGPLGIFSLGSRRPNYFSPTDLDLLSQVATQISLAIDNALAYGQLSDSHERVEQERLYLESEIQSEYNFGDIVGKSAVLRQVLDRVAIVAPTSSTVLLHGETGTGKELIARAIHNLSPRKDRTFVRLNCAAIPSGLVESELFGHERGAFTGALMQKRGRFEIADRGTLFRDEIGDISLELQPKLLRALQEQEFERLGSSTTIHVDVRLIAATHRDLAAMIQANQFREDLFYRLNVFPIEIPPLRERREDIPMLVHYFVSRLARRMQKNVQTIARDDMQALAEAPWPGNVRELENFIERCVILTPGSELHVPLQELKLGVMVAAASPEPPQPARPRRPLTVTEPGPAFSTRRPQPDSVSPIAPAPFAVPPVEAGSTFADAERQAILEALRASGGRVSGPGGAAERLALKRTTLQNKMRKLGIPRSSKL